MKTLVVEDYKVGLMAKYGEYNCGNKTTGRLELVVTKGDSKANLTGGVIAVSLADPKVRDKIITNFLEDLGSQTTFETLSTSSGKFFPNDGGTYPPGVLIFADSIYVGKSITWWNNWKGLIEVFETEPKFGVVILKSPILPNKLYGPSKPSRVWTICLPSVAKHICFDKQSTTPEMKASLANAKVNYCESKLLKAELSALGV